MVWDARVLVSWASPCLFAGNLDMPLFRINGAEPRARQRTVACTLTNAQ